jgi:hypothetical protein
MPNKPKAVKHPSAKYRIPGTTRKLVNTGRKTRVHGGFDPEKVKSA